MNIFEVIKQSEEFKALADAGNDSGLAAAINLTLTPVPKEGTFVGERGIYAVLGMTDGEIFMQTVEGIAASSDPAAAPFKRVMRWLKDAIGVDMGQLVVQQTLLFMSVANGGLFSNESVAKLIEFGSKIQTITTSEVSQALAPYRPEGTSTVTWGE